MEEIDQQTGEVTQRPAKYGSKAPSRKEPDRSNGDTKPAQDGNGRASDKQIGLVQVKLNQAGLSAEDLCTAFELGALPDLPFKRVNEALEWIRNKAKEQQT